MPISNKESTKTKEAFNSQAGIFDALYDNDIIVRYKRSRVYAHVKKFMHEGSSILELNAGTGNDAIYFATQGHSVHATDVSENMQEVFNSKIANAGLQHKITHEICDFIALENLHNKGPYDYIFSNFAGLNCTDRLDKVLSEIKTLLVPGGKITMVIMPSFCLWEFLQIFKGNFKTALRRFSGKKGTQAHIEGVNFQCWYYHASYIKKRLKEDFEVLAHEALCVCVPPSYMQNFPVRFPRIYKFLQFAESVLKTYWPWKNIGDYYIITLQKRK